MAKAILVSAVPPIMLKTDRYPGGLPIEVFDGLRAGLAANRAQFFRDVASGPFYGFNRSGAELKPAVVAGIREELIRNCYRPILACRD